MAERPYELIGAGKLVSAVWKRADDEHGFVYRFNVYRMNDHTPHRVDSLREPGRTKVVLKGL